MGPEKATRSQYTYRSKPALMPPNRLRFFQSPESGKAKLRTLCNAVHERQRGTNRRDGIMELEIHESNGIGMVPEVTPETTESTEWPERAAQAKGKRSKLTSSQARVSQLLDMLGEIDNKRVKLDNERDELKKQLANAVANL
jgi:hypothetical protein